MQYNDVKHYKYARIIGSSIKYKIGGFSETPGGEVDVVFLKSEHEINGKWTDINFIKFINDIPEGNPNNLFARKGLI